MNDSSQTTLPMAIVTNQHKALQDYEKIIRECVKCGVCQAHCPAYLASRREGAVARSKVALAAALLDGQVGLEGRLAEDIGLCLMCGSCVAKCPNKVPTDEIVGAIRREITDNKGLSPLGKGVAALLGSPALMKTLGKGGALVAPLMFKKVPETSGLRLRFPPAAMKDRTVPKIAFRNLFDRVKEFYEGEPGKPVIGFFAGCAITYLYPEIGEQMIALLRRLGYSVFIPKNQRCCGIPALSTGNGRLVAELAEHNVAAFGRRRVSHIVTACASCNRGTGEYYAGMQGAFGDFAGKVIDFSVFLKNDGYLARLATMAKRPERLRVTYHDPCHLKSQGITREPRDLLRALPQVDFVEMADADACCGLGGTFSATHYEMSKKIGARKVAGLRESGAGLVATACPGCVIQLQDIIDQAGLPMKAVHLLELLAQAGS